MKILVFAQRIYEADIEYVNTVVDILSISGVEIVVYEPFLKKLRQIPKKLDIIDSLSSWSTKEEVANGRYDFMFTMGGDGTILQAVTFVRDSGIPIIGINLGRLGFLASVAKKRIEEALQQFLRRQYTLEERQLLHLDSDTPLFGDDNFALNDFTIHKKDTSSMITIHTQINGEWLNSYWADGIIVSTPTGSTGYSLSCGGPIIFPGSGNFIITPVAPHNLNVRPVVIKDDAEITFEIEGRSPNHLCTLDSRFATIKSGQKISIKKEKFAIQLVHLNNFTFLKTMQEKLSWGVDRRNA